MTTMPSLTSLPPLLALTASTLAAASSYTGQATFYSGNVQGGACSFSTYTLPSTPFSTALSDSNWDSSANCGACVSVTGPGGNSRWLMARVSGSGYQSAC